MGKVISLNGVPPPEAGQPQSALVEMLEDMLKMAKNGELQSLVAVGFTAEGLRLAMWADVHPNVYEMLGSIAWLQAEYVHRHSEALG